MTTQPQTMDDVLTLPIDEFVTWLSERWPQKPATDLAAHPLGIPCSGPITQLATALAKAQADFPTIPRDRLVTVFTRAKESRPASSYTFRYAPLETILDKTRGPLAANGLALVQATVVDASGVEVVRTVLMHSSGEWISNDVPIFVGTGDNKSQAYSSGVTYSRRYGVTLLLCVAADEDDDGNGGEQDGDRQMPDYVRQGGGERRPAGGNTSSGPRAPQRRSSSQPAPDDIDEARAMFRDDERKPVDVDTDTTPKEPPPPVSPWGEDLSAGELKMAKQRAKVAGLDDAGVLELLDWEPMTKANAAESLAALKRAADKALGN